MRVIMRLPVASRQFEQCILSEGVWMSYSNATRHVARRERLVEEKGKRCAVSSRVAMETSATVGPLSTPLLHLFDVAEACHATSG